MSYINMKEIIKNQIALQSDGAMSVFNKLLCIALLVGAMNAILETEISLHPRYDSLFQSVETLVSFLFLIEYILRIWIATDRNGVPGVKDRILYAMSPLAVIDLLCISPLLIGFMGGEIYLMKAMRVIRIIRIIRIGKLSNALEDIYAAIASRKFELMVSIMLAFVLLMVSSAMLYFVEGAVQPEIFGSIPRAMWWSVATLTTVGYGDVFPVTPLGRILAGITAILGIGLIAMPTGILASAFSEGIQSRKERKNLK